MRRRTLTELDAGQLDLMWSFLQFKKRALSLADIEGIENNLNSIRQLMIQKTAGQKQYSTGEALDLADLGTYINLVVIYAMGIFLDGGFEKLREMIKNESEENENG